jgi:hypothetical protein
MFVELRGITIKITRFKCAYIGDPVQAQYIFFMSQCRAGFRSSSKISLPHRQKNYYTGAPPLNEQQRCGTL